MKMSRQNPGGVVHAKPTMKGCEQGKWMNKGKGNIMQSDYTCADPRKKQARATATDMDGQVMKGHIRVDSHVKTSMTGSTVTGSSKANRQ